MIVKGIGDSGGFFSNIRRTAETPSPRTESAGTFGNVLRGRTDTVEISGHQTAQSVLKETKEDVMKELKLPTDQVTLDGLKNRIASGTYDISADELAAILGE